MIPAKLCMNWTNVHTGNRSRTMRTSHVYPSVTETGICDADELYSSLFHQNGSIKEKEKKLN